METKIIVAFHVGRGGRSYNAGHTSFIGEKRISEFTNDLFTRFENERDFTDRFGFDDTHGTGIKCILDCMADENFEILEEQYGIKESDLGEIEYYKGESGDGVGLTKKEADTGIGTINIDNGYSTTYTKLIEDCSEHEIELILKCNSYKSQGLEDWLINNEL